MLILVPPLASFQIPILNCIQHEYHAHLGSRSPVYSPPAPSSQNTSNQNFAMVAQSNLASQTAAPEALSTASLPPGLAQSSKRS